MYKVLPFDRPFLFHCYVDNFVIALYLCDNINNSVVAVRSNPFDFTFDIRRNHNSVLDKACFCVTAMMSPPVT